MPEIPAGLIEVEVVYAVPQEQFVQILLVPPGSTIGGVMERSGLLARHPELSLGGLRVGIFGKRKSVSDEVREFDRVEIYRTLIADPKVARRKRARSTGY